MKLRSSLKMLLFISIFALMSCSSSNNEPSANSSTVIIGAQTWMLRNLDVATYRNGDPIPQVSDPTAWANLTTGAWCYWNNDPANGAIYGKLYNWYAVNDPRGLAPSGFHVPSDAEWTALTTFLGGLSVSGNKMKSTTGWTTYSGIANTNSSGFTGLPGGCRYFGGTYTFIGERGIWWSSTEYPISYAWHILLEFDNNQATRTSYSKKMGFSVRCLKD